MGDQASDFEERPIGEETTLCQRYYEKFDDCIVGFGDVTSGQNTVQGVYFSTTKRVAPTMTVTHVAGGRFNGSGIGTQDEALGGVMVFQTCSSTGANGWFRFDYTADAEL